MGEFTATRFEKAPVIDGEVAPGEWDRALTTSGLMTPFEHTLQTAETTMSMGFDAERFYFLFRCRRADFEWKLWKIARENDGYSFGEPSVEVWVSPPSKVAETFQSVINTYPAVLDTHMIPSRGYNAMGWRGNWQIGVKETDTHYVIEAAIPIRDFGYETVRSGDVWRFLLCRNALQAQPRSQASWSVTQAFAEIPQHPPVRLMDDEAVLQLENVTSILSGRYLFPVTVVAPRGQDATVDVEVRFHKAKSPGGDDDYAEKKQVRVAAGARGRVEFAGDATAWTPANDKGVRSGHFTVTATKTDGTVIFRQSFAYTINGWQPSGPKRPDNVAPAADLPVSARFGPETSSLLVRADLLDLPDRAAAAAIEVEVVDPATGQVLARGAAGAIREWYASAILKVDPAVVPVADFTRLADYWAEVHRIRNQNNAIKAENERREAANKRLKEGQTPQELLPRIPLPRPPEKTPGKPVEVIVMVKDRAGHELRRTQTTVELLRYHAEWMNNDIGITDQVIPPWTPVEAGPSGEVKVWNRTLTLDGLGLARQVNNGGTAQVREMRLVVVKDGQPQVVSAGAPRRQRSVPAEADYVGTATVAGLKLAARTRVEFDGFVKVDLDVAPADGPAATVDQLYLEVVLPAEEATHFCATAGGWAAVHDALPERWSSQKVGSGMLQGDFVPYIWLTNGERAFLWFADTDKGWHHEPARQLPTQEVVRQGDDVVLRVRFFEIPTTVDAPRTITWGWQTFPSKPLPAGWRATVCASHKPTPNTRNTYFWFEADWAVSWPYYCSPFPWSMEKSKSLFDKFPRDSSHRPMVGSIAHSIGRYQDYDGNQFPGLAVDWGESPGHIGNADVTASKGPNDFRLWHYRKWVREAGFRGLYVDENYIALEENYLTGNAYWRPDGGLQRAYNYLGLRDYFKRLKVMFHQEGVPPPNLWLHITSGAGYHAWLGEIFFEGENVEPTDLEFDYLEVLPAGRLRAIGSAVCAGGTMTMMCQSLRHKTQWWQKHTHQFVGWVMAHDILPEQVPLYPLLMEAGRLYRDDVVFRPYWKPSPFTTTAKDCLVSAHTTPGRALLWVVNTRRADAVVPVQVDWQAAGLDPANVQVLDAETGAPLNLTAIAVPSRDFVPVLIAPKSTETFLATFDNGPRADFALGCDLLEPTGQVAALPLVDDGRGGKALAVEGGMKLLAPLHLADPAGRISFRVQVPDKAQGPVVTVGALAVQLQAGKAPQMVVRAGNVSTNAPALAPGWHDLVVAWDNGRAHVRVAGQPVAELPVESLGLVLDPRTGKPPVVTFGGRGNVIAVDDIRCYRAAN